jgi:hypothetical protein
MTTPFQMRLSADLLDALRVLKTVTGAPVSAQIDLALRRWLDDRRESDRAYYGINRPKLGKQQ